MADLASHSIVNGRRGAEAQPLTGPLNSDVAFSIAETNIGSVPGEEQKSLRSLSLNDYAPASIMLPGVRPSDECATP